MPWNPDDKERIIRLLNLSRNLLIPSSLLQILMDYRAQFDAQYGTDTIGEIQGFLGQIETLNANLTSSDISGSNVKRYKVDGEYEVENFAAGLDTSETRNRITQLKDQVIFLLEDNYYYFYRGWGRATLRHYIYRARPIPT